MRITRIDIEGPEGHYAKITRQRGSHWIVVTILTPCQPDGKELRIPADADESELRNQARNLHLAIGGCSDASSDINDYLRELQRFADLNEPKEMAMSKTDCQAPPPEHMLAVALRENLSPPAVALIAAKCQPRYGKGEAGLKAEGEVAWFTELLVGMIGREEYSRFCDELGV